MTTELLYFLPPMFGMGLIALGIRIEDVWTGMFGALVIFLFGVAILVNPITSVSSLMNDVIGTISVGYGAYILIRGGTENAAKDLDQ